MRIHRVFHVVNVMWIWTQAQYFTILTAKPMLGDYQKSANSLPHLQIAIISHQMLSMHVLLWALFFFLSLLSSVLTFCLNVKLLNVQTNEMTPLNWRKSEMMCDVTPIKLTLWLGGISIAIENRLKLNWATCHVWSSHSYNKKLLKSNKLKLVSVRKYTAFSLFYVQLTYHSTYLFPHNQLFVAGSCSFGLFALSI